MSRDKGNVISLPSEEEIEAKAAMWVTVLGRASVSKEDLAAFRNWLEMSDRHRSAFDGLAGFAGELKILRRLNAIAVSMEESSPPKRLRVGRRAFAAMAASSAFAVIAAGAFYVMQGADRRQSSEYATALGEQKIFNLSDGSVMYLNTDSRAELAYSDGERAVRLVQGEAYFDVAKDAARPFKVYAGNRAVKAVGTAFSVRVRSGDSVEVTVEEGRVALEALLNSTIDAMSGQSPIISEPLEELVAGQRALFGEDRAEVKNISAPEIRRKLAWRQGMVAYSEEKLADVVDDIGRYSKVTIEIADSDLRDMLVSGYFRVGEVDTVLEAFELNLGIRVIRVDEHHVLLLPSS